MVVRLRRAVPGDGLIILVSAVSSNILNLISWLSIKICKLGLSKTLNVSSCSGAVSGTSGL
jgi:hypothetical protein